MIRIVTGRRSLERIALDGDPAPEDLLPGVRFIDDAIADLLQYRRVGMPDAGVGHRLARGHVEIVARRHLLRPGCLRVPEVDPDLRFVGALVRRESDVPVDAGQGSAEGLRVRDDVRADLLQARPASRMNCKLGSCTAFSYRSSFSVNHSLLLFFARSLKNAK